MLFVNNIADLQENECSWLSCNYSTWDWQRGENERQQVFHLSGYFRTTYRIHWGSGWLGLSRNQPFADFNSESFASVYPTLGLRVFKLSVRGNRWSVKAMWRYLFASESTQVMGNSVCMFFQRKVSPSNACRSYEIRLKAGFYSFLSHIWKSLVKFECNGRC